MSSKATYTNKMGQTVKVEIRGPKTTAKPTCPHCKGEQQIEIPTQGFLEWINGALIQDALPTADADTREALMTGICPKCWDTMFKEEEEDEGDPEPMDPREPYEPGEDAHIDQTSERE